MGIRTTYHVYSNEYNNPMYNAHEHMGDGCALYTTKYGILIHTSIYLPIHRDSFDSTPPV